MARSSASIINDLHELLQRTPVMGPFVLVGHSIGGEYVRIFAAKYPSEVAGLVLVDSTHPDQREPAVLTAFQCSLVGLCATRCRSWEGLEWCAC